MKILYYLVVGEARIECGADAPTYDPDQRAWVLSDGQRVSDFDGTHYALEHEEVEPEGPTITPELLNAVASQLLVVVDQHIDATAKAFGYESIVTAVSYADEPAVPRFQAEGQALRAWRSMVYARTFELRDEAAAGLRAIPDTLELIGNADAGIPGLLPAFVAPT